MKVATSTRLSVTLRWAGSNTDTAVSRGLTPLPSLQDANSPTKLQLGLDTNE